MSVLVPLLVGLPLLGAAITLIFGRNARLQVLVTVLTLAAVSVIAAVLLVAVDAGAPIAVSVGGWPVPFGIVLYVDRLAALLVLISSIVLLAVLLFGCVLVAQNPLIEKRNAIGPVYLTLLLLAVPWFSRTPRRQATTLLLLTGVFFPLASIFTHVNMDAWDIAEILDPWMYFSHFLDLHYDAWSNIHTVLEMVNRDGLRYGEQILGSLLFFVPHTLWEAKPHATGIDIGQFLMAYYKLDFDNLSSPLIAEGYIDFSVFGVVFVAIALALITRFLDRLIHAGGPVGKPAGIYFSIYLIFVLRGALMVAVAYGSGAAMAFMTISWFVTRRRRRVQRAVPRTAPASSGSPVTPIRRAAPPRRA